MVTDIGGIDDKSFNASAWKGLQAAEGAPTPTSTIKNVASKAEADYEPNLTQFVNQKCDFILAVGGLMGDATEKIAEGEPEPAVRHRGRASAGDANVYPMQFDTAQAAFLAGYLAAGLLKTGKVGTYGGLKIPPVTIFMDGFADGVAYYNKAKGKNVQVLGWDKATQNGTFADDFVDQDKGKKITDALVAQGADVDHAGRRRHRPGHRRRGQGVRRQVLGHLGRRRRLREHPQYCAAFLTTVVKNIPDAVKDAVLKGAKGEKLPADAGLPRHAGEQRRLDRPVPRVRQQGRRPS